MSMTWTEFIGVSEPNAHLSVPINKAQYEEIYLKAFKAGMTEAASITINYTDRLNKSIEPIKDDKEAQGVAQWYVHALCNANSAILTARDNKTTI